MRIAVLNRSGSRNIDACGMVTVSLPKLAIDGESGDSRRSRYSEAKEENS